MSNTVPSPDPTRSALFVDFDNVYIGLRKQEPELARQFAEQPGRWIEWLQRDLRIRSGSWVAPQRRILVRRCYLNPQSFGAWRAYFIRNGFETIDCPPLTAQGKTSADVHMVLDIVDLLSGTTTFDEFIIMSADADFTPVLLKLRKNDRRTIVLAIGPSSSAYAAASDLVIDQGVFRDFLAGDLIPEAPPVAEPAVALPVVSPRDFLTHHRIEISRRVRDLVETSPAPVSLSALANSVRTSHPELASQWGGCGTFATMLGELDLAALARTNVGPGYLYDPERHAPPSEIARADSDADATYDDDAVPAPLQDDDVSEWGDSKTRDVARRVADLTDTPYLPPRMYSELFHALADEINANEYQMSRVSKAVRDELQRRGLPIGRTAVDFVLRGIAFAGHRFGKANEDATDLAKAFYRNTLTLCVRNQLYLATEEQRTLHEWLVGGDETSRDANDPEDGGTDGAQGRNWPATALDGSVSY